MNRSIVTLPAGSAGPAASAPAPAETAEPASGIATPAPTSVGTSNESAGLLDVAAALRAADQAIAGNPQPGGPQTVTQSSPAASAPAQAAPAHAAAAPAAAPAAAAQATAAQTAAAQTAAAQAATAQASAAQAATARAAGTRAAATPAALPAQDVGPGQASAAGSSRKDRAGGFSLGPAQIVCWQLAVVAVAVAVGARVGLPGTIATVAGALALIAVTTIRVRGTWLHQWLGIAVRYVLRRRRTELPQNADAATALLGMWLGDTGIDVALVRDRPMTLISDRTALGAILRLDTSDPGAIRQALAGLRRQDGALLAAVDEQQVDLEAQLVVHGGLHADRTPFGWLAVTAYRSVGLSTDEALTKVLKNAVRRVQRHLERAGASTEPVDASEAATTVVALAHADAGRGHLHERWSALTAGPVSQACLRLAGFGQLEPAEAEALLASLLSTSSGAAVTFSVGTRLARGAGTGGTGGVRHHDPVLRVAAASPGALELAVTVLGRVAGGYRLRPERLDGRHGPATAASLPIGRSQV